MNEMLTAEDLTRFWYWCSQSFATREVSMKKVQEPTVRKTRTVATCRIHWQPRIGLVAALVAMSVVVLSGQELKHVPPGAPSFAVLHSFTGPPTDGTNPVAGLVRDAAGNLYGATPDNPYAAGTVFKLSSDCTETVLYSFTGGADGAYPEAGLIRDKAGNLYGTTAGGGAHAYDYGVVFKLGATGTQTVLHSFTGRADGANPFAGLIEDASGNLYGTTYYGANPACNVGLGCGTVFTLIRCDSEPSGYEFKVLYSFTGGADGGSPQAGLLRDAAGNLYGTTDLGGAESEACSGFGHACGVVFKLSPTGTESVLHTFTGGADGANPYAGLTQDAAGNLYGTASGGGSSACNPPYGCGVVFKLSPTGPDFTVLHSFTGGADGQLPLAGLVRDAAGNLYGTTAFGGASDNGVVFKLSTTGIEMVLHSFTGGADGAQPYAGLILDLAGNLYGTTKYGGDNSSTCYKGTCGVVFRLAPN
jgi:uncharacterized repeat protein (TIGR03803 family)